MALQELKFSFKADGDLVEMPKDWSHTGVVGSGDLEILMRHESLKGAVNFIVNTPVKGFDAIWGKVLEKFVRDSHLSNCEIRINDNNATPYIVAMRLKQALLEAKEDDAQ